MEIIEITSYTSNEKYHIAREHLIPKQLERNGLTKSQHYDHKTGPMAFIEALYA